MRCPYCGSQYVSRQQLPLKAVIKLLTPGFFMLLAGWPFKLKLMVLAGLGLIVFALIIGLVTTLPRLFLKTRTYWECDACDRVFELPRNP